MLPADGPALPLFVAGLAQQQPAWIGQHMDGCLAYPGTPQDHVQRVAAWRAVGGNKPYASFIHLDLVADADAPLQRWRFGLRGGRNALLAELHAMRAAGVDHIGLQFRRNETAVGRNLPRNRRVRAAALPGPRRRRCAACPACRPRDA